MLLQLAGLQSSPPACVALLLRRRVEPALQLHESTRERGRGRGRGQRRVASVWRPYCSSTPTGHRALPKQATAACEWPPSQRRPQQAAASFTQPSRLASRAHRHSPAVAANLQPTVPTVPANLNPVVCCLPSCHRCHRPLFDLVWRGPLSKSAAIRLPGGPCVLPPISHRR